MTTPDPNPVADRVTPRWQDPALPAADRVELLLEQMTLEEKVAQLGSRWIGGGPPDARAMGHTLQLVIIAEILAILDEHEVVRGSQSLPDGFRAKQTTVQILDRAQIAVDHKSQQ